jgi:hypothetical protein
MEEKDAIAQDSGVNESTEESELDLTEDKPQEQKPEETAEYWKNKYFKQVRQKPKINNQVEMPKPLDLIKSEEMKLFREGYNEDEIDLIMKNGGRKVLENENNPLTLGIKIAREQRDAEIAASKATSTSSGNDPILSKVSLDDLKNMTAEEMAKILPHAD